MLPIYYDRTTNLTNIKMVSYIYVKSTNMQDIWTDENTSIEKVYPCFSNKSIFCLMRKYILVHLSGMVVQIFFSGIEIKLSYLIYK